MRRPALWFTVLILAATQGVRSDNARSISLIAPGGARAALEELLPKYQRQSGYKIDATYAPGLETTRQVLHSEAFDVPIVQSPYDQVLTSGHVRPDSLAPIASISVGVAVRHGAARPDISTPEAVKRVLLAAAAITYPDPARGMASGVSVEAMLRALGIDSQVHAKVRRPPSGTNILQLLADGQVDVGLAFISEMNVPGVAVIGPLPRALIAPTVLVGFVAAHPKDPPAAQALLRYLTSSTAKRAYRAHGMQPAP